MSFTGESKGFINYIYERYKNLRIKDITLVFEGQITHQIMKSLTGLVEEQLEQHISAGLVNDYYEAVLAKMITDGRLFFKPVFFDARQWYEIDTLSDLYESEMIFTGNRARLNRQNPDEVFYVRSD